MYKALLYLELRVTQTAINRNSLPHKTCEHPLNKDKSLDHVEIRKMSLKGRTIELSDDLLETGGSQGAEPEGRGWQPARAAPQITCFRCDCVLTSYLFARNGCGKIFPNAKSVLPSGRHGSPRAPNPWIKI